MLYIDIGLDYVGCCSEAYSLICSWPGSLVAEGLNHQGDVASWDAVELAGDPPAGAASSTLAAVCVM